MMTEVREPEEQERHLVKMILEGKGHIRSQQD